MKLGITKKQLEQTVFGITSLIVFIFIEILLIYTFVINTVDILGIFIFIILSIIASMVEIIVLENLEIIEFERE